ncbi:phospholipid/cholesterol/gamma-HCH transport system substrate-binding protein [Kutzneria viridogrisea]|uniref:Phospholipid/cholesterol/gamma-HCH transport system substrate-binding protein n=1 Tax=Kutzneria viridogrisea TaxID=47990 RepID=A0ABR6BHG2_9PSEU|nr:phospholipid/cholesterol/gamma-HCH transport system substrate-binding protein [Kutzneria viridogrisea]
MRRPALLCALLLLGGCGLGGPPETTVLVEFGDVANLVVNSEVKVDDVTVGSVRRIELDGWHARLTLGLNTVAGLPRNATAKIGQKSLLGAEYVELAAPRDEPLTGTLRDGDLIPLARTTRYPETEELLAGLSLWLNGGGLGNIRTITAEVDKALSGREKNARDLLDQVRRFADGLDQQKAAIVKAIEALDALSAPLAQQREQLGAALDHLTPGVRVLAEQRDHLTDALNSLANLSTVATRVVGESKQDLVDNLTALQPILTKLADSGDALPRSLQVAATVLYPLDKHKQVFRGDFANLFVTLDLSLPTLGHSLLGGALQAVNPLLAPIGGR